MRKSYFLAGGTPKNDDLLRKTAAQIATLHTATWCQTRTPRGGVWSRQLYLIVKVMLKSSNRSKKVVDATYATPAMARAR